MSRAARALILFLAAGALGCGGIRLQDIRTPLPVPERSCLVVGFLGGRDAWDDDAKGVRQLALRLRSNAERIAAETFENRRRSVAEQFLLEALDRDRDGRVAAAEAEAVKVVVFGQSFGGAAVVKFARRLAELAIPVDLSVQIDSVGRRDGSIPRNVRHAANLFQDNGWFIRGQHPVRAEDPSQTEILGNWRFDYGESPRSDISIVGVPWWKLLFRVAHAKMDRDPSVWELVEELVVTACRGGELQAVQPAESAVLAQERRVRRK